MAAMTQPSESYLREIVLLADPVLAPILAQTILLAHPLASPKALMRAAPILKVTPLSTLPELIARCGAPLAGARLFACATEVIVPEKLLAAFPGPSYNLHPGPPAYPGRFPAVFALYGGAAEFGSTLHEMTGKVDDGPIVAVDRFAVPPEADRAVLETHSFASVLRLLVRMCADLVRPAPLPRLPGEAWSGGKASQADFDALCRLPEGVDAAEFARRYRAVGEGPEHALEISLFGHRFRLDNRRGDAVTVAGCPRPAELDAKAAATHKGTGAPPGEGGAAAGSGKG